jgi:hypothetical protein
MSYVQVSVDRRHPLLTNEFLRLFNDVLADFIVNRLAPVEFKLTKELIEIEVRDYVEAVDRRDPRFPLQVRVYGNDFPSRMVNINERLALLRADVERYLNGRIGASIWLTFAGGAFATL